MDGKLTFTCPAATRPPGRMTPLSHLAWPKMPHHMARLAGSRDRRKAGNLKCMAGMDVKVGGSKSMGRSWNLETK